MSMEYSRRGSVNVKVARSAARAQQQQYLSAARSVGETGQRRDPMMNFRNVLIGLAILALAAGIIISCGGGSGDNTPSGSGSSSGGAAAMVIRSASLDGTQAGTLATGIGRGAVVVNPATRGITGGITFTG